MCLSFCMCVWEKENEWTMHEGSWKWIPDSAQLTSTSALISWAVKSLLWHRITAATYYLCISFLSLQFINDNCFCVTTWEFKFQPQIYSGRTGSSLYSRKRRIRKNYRAPNASFSEELLSRRCSIVTTALKWPFIPLPSSSSSSSSPLCLSLIWSCYSPVHSAALWR